MFRWFLPLVVLLAPLVTAQPNCLESLDSYDGPCPHGLLPAFFDDFTYTTADMVRAPESLPANDLFGVNSWTYDDGEHPERGWFRYSRHDLALPGTITFEPPSVLRAVLPGGFAAEDYVRSMSFYSRPLMKEGTYAWRVRLSNLAAGTRVRQAFWVMSPTTYLFESSSAKGPSRYQYWSELDFENENHFRGEYRNGTFYPDFVTRMSVGNHFGKLYSPQGTLRLAKSGTAEWSDGSGTLARNGAATTAPVEAAPRVHSWANMWLYLMLNVENETVTYSMIPELSGGDLSAVGARSVAVGPDFYPRDLMHMVLSLHWIEPEGRLDLPLWLESDWVYYTPVEGLSLDAVLAQVEGLRTRDIERANTTERHHASVSPPTLEIEGPERAACEQTTQWTATTSSPGTYFMTSRYRLIHASGKAETWNDLTTRTIKLRPQRRHSAIEIEATAQVLWGSHGTIKRNGWEYPDPRNTKVEARRVIPVDCRAARR